MSRHRWTNEEIAEYRKARGGLGAYFNRDDTRVIVPKAFGYGITFNWANPLSWLAVVALIAAILLIKSYIR